MNLDLYEDYLLSSQGRVSATELSDILEGHISHDKITRFLSDHSFSSKDLWLKSKKLVREFEHSEACLIFDDTIISKPHMKENDLISWHWDHSKGTSVKVINLLTAFYHTESDQLKCPLRIPICYENIIKNVFYTDSKRGKEKRKSKQTKNELLRDMVAQMIHNQLVFRYVLADSWFSSSENMRYIHDRDKYFIFDLKSNRKIALSDQDRIKGNWTQIKSADLPINTPVPVWLNELDIEVLVIKQVFKNENSTGVRYLVSNDLNLSNSDFEDLYKKRWSVEEYHKSLKQNAAIAKSPSRKVRTQSNHIFASITAYLKLETIKIKKNLNHFKLKSIMIINATKTAMKTLIDMKEEAFA